MITKEEFEELKRTINEEPEEEEERELYKIELNKEELEKRYIRRGQTIKQIAKMYNHIPAYIKLKLEEYGIPLRSTDTIWWKENKEGYITIHIDGKSYAEHRYIYEQVYGPIPKGWLVHHLNGIKNDNWPENVCAMSRTKHGIDQLFPAFEKRIVGLEKEVEQLNELVQSYEDYIYKTPT